MAHIHLAAIIGRAIRHQQNFSAAFGQRFAHAEVVPDFLADRNADADTPEIVGTGNGAFGENTLLVELAIVGKIDLVAQRQYFAAIQQRHRIVPHRLTLTREADDHARPAIRRFRGQFFHSLQAGLQKGWLQD